MAKLEKVQDLIKDEIKLQEAIEEYYDGMKSFTFKMTLDGKPENYVRERYNPRGKNFYNKKDAKMNDIHKEIKNKITGEVKAVMDDLLKMGKNAKYQVQVKAKYYKKIPEADSIKTAALKELGIIRPKTTPDTDNYIKLTLDVLHNLFYDDDKRVISITSEKFFSFNPRTEIEIHVNYKLNN